MIRPLPNGLPDVLSNYESRARPFPMLDRAFDSVERALARLGIEDPGSLRSPRPVEDALSPKALPDGTLLILDANELRAAELDIEETVKDERLSGSVFVSLPSHDDLATRARPLRELAGAAHTIGFNGSLQPLPATRLGRVRQVPMPSALRPYRFLCADTPGFRVLVIARALPGGGFVALWTGNERAIAEFRTVVDEAIDGAGHRVPDAAPTVPPLDGVASEDDVWAQAEELRAYRVIREAELREIARQAALRGVQLRREREAKRRAEEKRLKRAS